MIELFINFKLMIKILNYYSKIALSVNVQKQQYSPITHTPNPLKQIKNSYTKNISTTIPANVFHVYIFTTF